MKHLFFFAVGIILLSGCKKENQPILKKENSTEYANHLSIRNDTFFTEFDTLVLNEKLAPVSKVFCFSSTHIAFLEALDALDVVKGISAKRYVYNPIIVDKVEQGEIVEIGEEFLLNEEFIFKEKPDVVLINSFLDQKQVQRLKKLGIKVLPITEYKEQHPLGRLEWIKLFGALLGKQDLANTYFDAVKNSYQKQVHSCEVDCPEVLVGTSFQGTWYLPNQNTFMSQLIKDAGGNYQTPDSTELPSLSLSIEQVYAAYEDADYWINQGSFSSLDQLKDSDNRYALFNAFQTGECYNFDKRKSELGALDFYEKGVVRPDRILSDLKNIFTGVQDSMYFYRKLE